LNADESAEDVEARSRLAAALQRLGHALVGHRVDRALSDRITSVASGFEREVTARTVRNRTAEVTASERFAASDGWEPIGTDGEPMELFRDSIVSGRTNPMGVGVQARRVGDAVEAVVALGAAFEGAPGRAHGGVVAAILDETMGYVLPVVGTLAYTANLSIDYIAPAPLHQELRFVARLRDRAGRKLWIEARGESAAGTFVRAEGLFLTIERSQFADGGSHE
jgi:acyl-coenzyme A thioesterase PaaI-like protein